MEKSEFENCCANLSAALEEYARGWQPEWEWHSGGKIKPQGDFRYELNRPRQQKGLGKLYLQYILVPDFIAVAVYLTQLDQPEMSRSRIEANRQSIEREVGPNSGWDIANGKRCRFFVPAATRGWQQDRPGNWERLAPGLAGMMWRFHKATLPLIGFEPAHSC